MILRNRRVALFAWLPAALIAGSFALVACGGDDDEGGSSGPPSDEEYVANLCGAMTTMQEEFESIGDEVGDAASLDELEDVLGDLADIVHDAADDVENANPPDDVEEINDQLVDTLRSFADALEEGDVEALTTFTPPEFTADPDVEARMEAAAAEVDECVGAGLF